MFRKLLDDAGEWKVGLTLGRLFWMKCLTGVGKWGKSGEEKQRRRQSPSGAGLLYGHWRTTAHACQIENGPRKVSTKG